MNIYTQELTKLKPHDPVQGNRFLDNGYMFITTAGHGYLVVHKDNKHIDKAKELCKYGFIGTEAVYLEEDCEAPEFLKSTVDFEARLRDFIKAGREFSKAWNIEFKDVKNYPKYLPSFDEFIEDFAQVEVDND